MPTYPSRSYLRPPPQARDRVLMKLAVLNELRMAIGSFAPCEVVMEGSTRVLPLVALRAASCETLPEGEVEGADAESSGEAGGGRRAGVSPNRHPQARMGAANFKVRMSVAVLFHESRANVCSCGWCCWWRECIFGGVGSLARLPAHELRVGECVRCVGFRSWPSCPLLYFSSGITAGRHLTTSVYDPRLSP